MLKSILKSLFGSIFLNKVKPKVEEVEKPRLVYFDEYSSHVVDGKFLTTKEYKAYLEKTSNGKGN